MNQTRYRVKVAGEVNLVAPNRDFFLGDTSFFKSPSANAAANT